MNFEEFKNDALRTESKPNKLNFNRRGLYLLMDCAVRMAKVVDTAKKTMFYGKKFDENAFRQSIIKLREELHRIEQRSYMVAVPEDALHHELHEPNMRIAHGCIGMYGEAGELLEALMKQMTTGNMDMTNLAEETGDSDWYKAIIHDESGISEETSRAKVIAKLKARYGDKFTNEAALNRDLKVERKILENTEAPKLTQVFTNNPREAVPPGGY